MDFKTYQTEALKTDITGSVASDFDASLIVPLLGLAGEAGQLLSEQKKFIRDGEAHLLYRERVAEELGDLLWYLSNVASKFSLDLGEIARANLAKSRDRFGPRRSEGHRFDTQFPPSERFPRQFEVAFVEGPKQRVEVRLVEDGRVIGDMLTDNARDPDGYRYHDIFHFAHAAVLGWSPITRKILKRKRKSDPTVDEIEDGGRAAVIEEGIAALTFEYARAHDFLREIRTIDYGLLRNIKGMTGHLECRVCSVGDWEKAILVGYEAWRDISSAKGGNLVVDLDNRSLSVKQR